MPTKKPTATAKKPVQKPAQKSVTKKSTHVEDSVSLDTKNILPVIFGGQAYYSVQGDPYYAFLKPKDDLFKVLLELRLSSLTQSNCINDKTFYSIGEGLQVSGQTFPTNFDKKINGKGQTIDDVLKAIFESIYQDGNKFCEVAVTTVSKQVYVHVYAHNNLDCRFAFDDEDDIDEPTHVIISTAFRRDGIQRFTKKDPPRRIPIWTDTPLKDQVWFEDANGVRRTMIVVKNEVQSVAPYGLPTNFAGMVQALTEHKIGSFNLDNFENNMFLAGVLTIIGQTSKDEAKKMLEQLRRQYIGEGKNNRVMVTSSEASGADTKWTPFQQSFEGHFVEFDKHNENKIIGANGWSRELLDMSDGSATLGKGGAFLAQLFQRKFRTIIKPVQQLVLNNFLFPFMKIMDEETGSKFYDLPWIIKPVVPVSLEGALDLNSLLTVDEGRDEIGKQAFPDKAIGAKLISTIPAKAAAPGTGTAAPTTI